MISRAPLLSRIAVIGALTLGLFGAGFAGPASAAAARHPIQSQDLALINAELARVNQIINRLAARQAHEPPGHVMLDVARLRADVHRIRSGIQSYLSPPRMIPRHLAPLSGHYREQHNEAQP